MSHEIQDTTECRYQSVRTIAGNDLDERQRKLTQGFVKVGVFAATSQ